MFCELFFRSCSFPTRVRAQVHVRSGLDALPLAPFLLGPLSPLFFRVLLGVAVSPCVRTPSCSSPPGPWNRVHSSLSWQPLFPFPLRLPRASLVPCQAVMFQVPRTSGLSPSCTMRRPQVTPASCLCRQAYGPCLISSVRLAPFACESHVPA